MATIQELYQKVITIENDIKDVKKKMKGSSDKEIAEVQKQLDNAKNNFENNKRTVEAFKLVEKYGTLSTEQANALDQAVLDCEKAKKEVEEKEKDLNSMKNKDELEKKLASLEKEQNNIMNDFAVNPVINDALKLRVEGKFLGKIEKARKDVEASKQEQADFNKALNDKKLLKPAVDKVQKAYKELSDVISLATSTDSAELKKFSTKQVAYVKAVNDLNKQTKSKFPNITISKDMVTVIASGAATTNYDFKPLDDLIAKQEKEYQSLIDSKDKAINRLETIKSKGTIDTTTIDGKISAQEAKKVAVEDEVTKKENELKAIEAYLNDLPNMKNELQNLRNKATDPALEKNVTDAENAIRPEMDKVVKAGYISKKVIPELGDKNSNISKLFEAYTKADKDLRKAFLDIQGVEKDPAVRDRLDKAIEDYKKVAKELADKSGFKVKDWNDYLKRTLNAKIKNGENIDEVYYDNTAKNRLDQIAKTYKLKDNNVGLQEVKESMDAIEKLKQDILLGQKEGTKAELDTALGGYMSKMKALAATLKVLPDALFNKIKAPVTKAAGWFKTLWQKIRSPKPGMLTVKKYSDEVKTSADNLGKQDGLLDKLGKAKEARDNAVASRLTQDEKTRKAELENKIAQEADMSNNKTTVEESLKLARESRTQIEKDLQQLKDDKNDLIVKRK